MFDLMGIKARRRALHLENVVLEQAQRLADAERTNAAQDAHISGLNGQVIAVRRLATEMRDRVHSHGKTNAEADFIRACLDIFDKGKKMSEHRFNYSMVAIKCERESLKDSPEWRAAR